MPLYEPRDIDLIYVAPTADTAINSVTDVTIVTKDIITLPGDQLFVDAWWIVLNNSTATRVHTFTLDFDGLFDVEFAGPATATSATLMNPMRITGVLDIRSTSLAYANFEFRTSLAAGVAAGADTTVAATMLQNYSWGTTASDVSATTTVALLARSASATATQTLRLNNFTIRKLKPT